MDKGAKPHTVKIIMDQLINYVESGRAVLALDSDVDQQQLLSGLLTLKERFK